MRIARLLSVIVLLVVLSPLAIGETLNFFTDDVLHLTCAGCVTNGTLLVSAGTPAFQVWRAPDTNGGLTTPPQLVLVAFVPGNSSLSFQFTNTGSPATNSPVTATLFSSTAWTSGDFYDYLVINKTGGPAAPISAFMPPPSGGFFVYQANMGGSSWSFAGCDSGTPCGDFGSSIDLPVGSVLYAYALNGSTYTYTTPGKNGHTYSFAPGADVQDAVAPSSSILITLTPEPASMMLLGAGLLGVFGVRKLRK